MPSPSSLFSPGLDQVAEHPRKKSQRNSHGYPSSLNRSPYLSSPIRPIPSFSRHRSSNLSVSSKRSRTINSTANSEDQSTVGSLRLTSPYSESIFSLHSLCTNASTTPRKENERQSLARTVLLPHEIDVMVKHMKAEQKDNLHSKASHLEENGNHDDQYDLSDFDDDSTVASDVANSVCDEDVYNLMNEEGDGEFLFERRDIHPKSNGGTASNENPVEKSSKPTAENEKTVSLPSVHLEHAKSSEIPEKKVKTKPSEKYSDFSLKRSPYAVNQKSKPKRSAGRKKKKIQDVYI